MNDFLPANPKDTEQKNTNLGSLVFKYFFQGLLIIAPIVLTIYLIFFLLAFLDKLIPIKIPGLGLLIILVFITGVGFLSQTFILKPIFKSLERLLAKLPLISIVYTSLQDLFSAFVSSDKKKFDRPVMLIINKQSDVKRLGFITQTDMRDFKSIDQFAVYCPHSYNFSGDLYIAPKENVILLDNISSTDAMKFTISGGVAGLQSQRNPKNDDSHLSEQNQIENNENIS